jgi:hypothetical protein
MPPSASLARFDQQADVTQMGAVILAIVLQRPMRANEYPRGVSDLIMTATESACGPGNTESAALRMWLQGALQVHPRVAFRSVVESQRSFADINSRPGARRAGAIALQVLLRTMCGPTNQPPVVLNATAPKISQPTAAASQPPVHADVSGPTLDFLRSVLQKD